MAAGSAAVLSSFLLNFCLAVGVFAAFSIIRVRPWCKRFFASRRFARDLDSRPKRLPNSPLGWVVPVLTYPEEDIIDETGLDCAMYLRILRFGLYLFVLLSFWCVATVLPANITSGEIDRVLSQGGGDSGTTVNGNVLRFTDFDHYSLTNVAPGSAKMWVHLSSIHFVVLTTLWLLWRFNRESVVLRLMFLGNAKRGGPSHTVLVTDIPGVSEIQEDRSELAPAGGGDDVRPVSDGAGGGGDSGGNANGGGGADVELPEQRQEPPSPQMTPSQRQQQQELPVSYSALTNSGGTAGGRKPYGGTAVSDKPGASSNDRKLDVMRSAYSSSDSPSSSSPSPSPSPSPAEVPSRGAVSGSGVSTTSAAAAAVDDASSAVRNSPQQQRTSFMRSLLGGRMSNASSDSAAACAAAGAARAQQSVAAAADPSAAAASAATTASGNSPQTVDSSSGNGGRSAANGGGSSESPSVQRREGAAAAAAAGGGGGNGGNGGGGEDAWRYAATGGRLEEPRVGPSNAELLRKLEAGSQDADEIALAVLPEWGIDTAPLPTSRRLTKRYNYDTQDCSLDAAYQAKQQLRSGLTPQQFVAREFALVYGPDDVAAVNMIHDTSDLAPLVAEYDKVREQLKDYLDKQQLRLRLRKALPHKQLTVLGAMYGSWGKEYTGSYCFKKVDAVNFWLARLRFLRERIAEEQRSAELRVAPSAFVTFTTRMSQAVASNSLHHHDVDAWRVHNAPAPFELVWKNLGLTMPVKSGRLYILWAAFWMMTLFFMIPVTAIQALIEVPKLAKVPVLGAIVTAPAVRQILEAIVPGLALKIFLAVVPIVLRYMALLSGATSASEIDFGVVKRYFLFQVIVVFFGNIIAGSFFNQLNQWVKNPGSVVTTLGKAIPMTSTFFITYVLTNGLGVKSLAFIRLPGFVIFWILSKFAGSPRARQRMWMYQYTDNGTTVVDHTITLLIGLTFSCINPIVCPAALAYFCVNLLGETYNNVYVFRRQYESAGRLWKTVYNQVMVGLYIMQLTMLGLLGLKKFKYAPLSVPLLLFSVGCHISTLRLYKRPWSVTALHDAADLDMWEADRRRQELLRAARQERKAASSGRGPLEAVEEGEAAGGGAGGGEVGAARATTTAMRTIPAAAAAAGPVERQFRRALVDERAALDLRPEEAERIGDLYKDPCFKVKLHKLSKLEALAADLRPRMDSLNSWTARLKKGGGGGGGGDGGGGGGGGNGQENLTEAPPLEVTEYDSSRLSDDGDTEDSAP
ncbi:hypothetical protein PLESTB_000282200 [Pleodorina starrii]|uniref:ERD4-related membrane protein n=1 Tax=Pleodorina starrii TaxID=330485 RepID=A0A9W6BCZ4_9CHLO|nr:hypothetical protein PLESTM_001407300 [Pleodorina starrii]GLC49743.1 hypothetical protein PLESTB_000282200 [Pleodorina starrii]GLC76046.1 hypothetical protein PLESTF_001724300 [Pleodorina starrii]